MFGWGKKKDKCDTCLTTTLREKVIQDGNMIRSYHDRLETLNLTCNELRMRYMELTDDNTALRKELKKWKGKEKVEFT